MDLICDLGGEITACPGKNSLWLQSRAFPAVAALQQVSSSTPCLTSHLTDLHGCTTITTIHKVKPLLPAIASQEPQDKKS
jgi:hypothetical protein